MQFDQCKYNVLLVVKDRIFILLEHVLYFLNKSLFMSLLVNTSSK